MKTSFTTLWIAVAAIAVAHAHATTAPLVPFDKAAQLVSTCGGMLAPDAVKGAAAVPIGDSDDTRWVLSRTSGGVTIRAYRSGLYLAAAGGRPTLRAAAATWRVMAAADGAVRLAPEDAPSAVLTMPDAGGATLSEPKAGDCRAAFTVDQFPMISPVLRKRWVDASAPDGGDGSAEKPYNTIFAAASTARAGDHIIVRPGTYRENVAIYKEHDGRPNAWIVLESQIPYAAKIEPPDTQGGIHVHGSFVEVHGFDVTNPSTEPCVTADQSAYVVRVVQNYLHDCGGGGVTLARAEGYHVEGNISARNAFRNGWQMSGISLYQARVSRDAVAARYVASLKFGNVIRRNITYLNDNHVTPTWGGKVPTDGNGIIVDDFYNRQQGSKAGTYPRRTLIEDNLAFANGGSGIRVVLSSNVVVQRNTAAFNMRRNDGMTWRGDVMNSGSAKNHFEANIAVADTGVNPLNVALFDSGRSPSDPGDGKNVGASWARNLGDSAPERGGGFRRLNGDPVRNEPGWTSYAVVFERPTLDGAASYRVTGLVGPDGRRFLAPEAGARTELLPPLR